MLNSSSEEIMDHFEVFHLRSDLKPHREERRQDRVDILQPRDVRYALLQLVNGHLIVQLRSVTALLLRQGELQRAELWLLGELQGCYWGSHRDVIGGVTGMLLEESQGCYWGRHRDVTWVSRECVKRRVDNYVTGG